MMDQLLLKLLKLTDSDNDNEAFVALRKAQARMKVVKFSWHDLDNNSSHGYAPQSSNRKSQANNSSNKIFDEEIPAMISVVESSLRHRNKIKELEFIESLNWFYQANNYLTVKQYNSLKKFYQNVQRHS